ncbi:pilus assembly protein [Myxococcota bacterium]|nr:pilus assembly protein [Myxococcota bacterium]
MIRVRKNERGQVLVETAIIMPVVVFLILGALQIVLLQHGRVMTEYAAYNAARAGIVHNANWNVMRNAALISVLPLYARTDDLEHLAVTWAKVKAAAEISEAVDTGSATLERLAGDLLGVSLPGLAQDISLIEINVTAPTAQDFRDWEDYVNKQEVFSRLVDRHAPLAYPSDGQEIDFDNLEFLKDHPTASRLSLEVRVLYPLKIPIVNKMIFELWLA